MDADRSGFLEGQGQLETLRPGQSRGPALEMRTTPASQIFQLACDLHRQPWSSKLGEDSLSLTDFRMVRGIFSDRLNSAWHAFPWPVLVNYEERRRLQRAYDYRTSYASGDQVFDALSNRCWFCVQPTAPDQFKPQESPDHWAQLGPMPFTVTNDPN